jgi:hypothetical protein
MKDPLLLLTWKTEPNFLKVYGNKILDLEEEKPQWKTAER